MITSSHFIYNWALAAACAPEGKEGTPVVLWTMRMRWFAFELIGWLFMITRHKVARVGLVWLGVHYLIMQFTPIVSLIFN